MTWIDIRTRKPTEKDADNNGCVLWLFNDKSILVFRWNEVKGAIAWMTPPPFTPAPDPPAGYRLVDVTTEPFDKRAMRWCEVAKMWKKTKNIDIFSLEFSYCVPINPPLPEGHRLADVLNEPYDTRAKWWSPERSEWRDTYAVGGRYEPTLIYCVPIDPPAPKYRPFANAAEYKPFAQKEWRYKGDHPSTVRFAHSYSDGWHNGDTWAESMDRKIFCDGAPFGMKEER